MKILSLLNFTGRRNIHRTIYLTLLTMVIISWFFPVKITTYAIMLLFLNWIVEGRWKIKWMRIKRDPLIIILSSVFLMYLISLIYSSDLAFGYAHTETAFSIMLFPFLIGTSDQLTKDELNTLLITFVLTTFCTLLLCFIYAFYQLIFNNIVNAFTIYRFHHITDIHRTYLGVAIVFSIYILFHVFISEISGRYRLRNKFVILLLLFFLVSLILVAARTPSIFFLGTFELLIIILAIKRFKAIKGILLFILINVAIAGLISLFLTPDIINKYMSSSSDVRLTIWQCAFESICQSPVIGHGIGDAKAALLAIYEKYGNNDLLELELNAHNQFIEITNETGIIGLILLLITFLTPLYLAIKERANLLIIFLLMIIATSITESVFNTLKGVVIFSLFTSLMSFNMLNIKKRQYKIG